MDLPTKPISLIRHIIIKLFCHHEYEEIYKVSLENNLGRVVKIEAARECKKCGRTKKVLL